MRSGQRCLTPGPMVLCTEVVWVTCHAFLPRAARAQSWGAQLACALYLASGSEEALLFLMPRGINWPHLLEVDQAGPRNTSGREEKYTDTQAPETERQGKRNRKTSRSGLHLGKPHDYWSSHTGSIYAALAGRASWKPHQRGGHAAQDPQPELQPGCSQRALPSQKVGCAGT